MKKLLLLIALSFIALISAQELRSPDGKFIMDFSIQNGGVPTYKLSYKGKEVIKPSKLGLELKTKDVPENDSKNSLYSNFEVVGSKTAIFDETWQPVWGESKNI